MEAIASRLEPIASREADGFLKIVKHRKRNESNFSRVLLQLYSCSGTLLRSVSITWQNLTLHGDNLPTVNDLHHTSRGSGRKYCSRRNLAASQNHASGFLEAIASRVDIASRVEVIAARLEAIGHRRPLLLGCLKRRSRHRATVRSPTFGPWSIAQRDRATWPDDGAVFFLSDLQAVYCWGSILEKIWPHSLAAPLNSVARLCVWAFSSSCPCLGRAPELCGWALLVLALVLLVLWPRWRTLCLPPASSGHVCNPCGSSWCLLLSS